MHYFIQPEGDVLQWCLSQDAKPRTLPFMPEQAEQGLVVAQLIGGQVFAEVVLSREHLVEIVGPGFPLGRLYFQIPKSALYLRCPELNPSAFGES